MLQPIGVSYSNFKLQLQWHCNSREDDFRAYNQDWYWGGGSCKCKCRGHALWNLPGADTGGGGGSSDPPPPYGCLHFFCLLICPGPCNNLDPLLKFLYETPPSECTNPPPPSESWIRACLPSMWSCCQVRGGGQGNPKNPEWTWTWTWTWWRL